jgi:hypothetical protein
MRPESGAITVNIELNQNEEAELDHYTVDFYNSTTRGANFDLIVRCKATWGH